MTITLVSQCSWAIQQHRWNCTHYTNKFKKTNYTRTNTTNTTP